MCKDSLSEADKDLRRFKRIELLKLLAFMVPVILGGISASVGAMVEIYFVRGHGLGVAPPGATLPVAVFVGMGFWGVAIVVAFVNMIFTKSEGYY